jgi:nucleoside-diphosphate-sugar epimerase
MDKTVSVLGCGWLGMAFGKKMISNGSVVKGSTTSQSRIEEIKAIGIRPYIVRIEPGWAFVPDNRFFETDVLVISIPPARVENITETLPRLMEEIIRHIEISGTEKVLMISSTSVYEASNKTVREGQEGNPDQLSGKALLVAEELLMGADLMATVVRFGGLMGPGRNPGRFFSGRRNIPGNVPVNLIHQADCVNILSEIIANNIWGEVFNACCPEHPLRKDFYTMAAKASGLPLPHFTDEQENYKIVNSELLMERLPYSFIYSNPMDYLKELSESEP